MRAREKRLGKISIIMLCATCLSVFAQSPGNVSAHGVALERYLPLESDIKGWAVDGLSQVFQGKDLFLYMDGGASIYDEYGFECLLVQNYLSSTGSSISLEIFEMASSAAAYGIYTFKCGLQGSEVRLGQESCLEDYYLNFWKGCYLVTLVGSDKSEETMGGLRILGTAVDLRIKRTGSKPELANSLLSRGLLEFSTTYYRGYLSLFNTYPFSNQDIFSFKEGIRGVYDSNYSIIILAYESVNECQKRFAIVSDSLLKNPRYKEFIRVKGNYFRFRDPEGDYLSISAFRQYILIVIDKESPGRARNIFRNIRTRL